MRQSNHLLHILKARQANLVAEWHKMLSECHHRLSCKFLKFIWLSLAGSTLVVDTKTVEFTCQPFFKAAVVRLSLGVCTLHLIEGYSATLPDMLYCQNDPKCVWHHKQTQNDKSPKSPKSNKTSRSCPWISPNTSWRRHFPPKTEQKTFRLCVPSRLGRCSNTHQRWIGRELALACLCQ